MLHIYNAQSAKKAARSLEKFATSLGFELKHGQALDALATMTGFQNWAALNDSVSQEAIDAKLMPVELDHIEDNQDVTYGPEYAVMAHNGFELRYAQGDEPLDYVRICDPLGREIAYWVSDEWQQDPQVVMGAILGALVQGGPLEVGAAKKPAKASGPAREATRPPTIMDLYPFDAVAHVVVDGRSFPVRYLDGDVAQLLEEPAADFDEEDDASHVVLDLHFEEDGRDVDHPLTVAELRELRWSAKEGGFVNKKGTLYEFYIEQKFGASASVAPKAAEVARSEDGPIELFEVFCRAPDGVQATSGVARVAAKSAQGAIAACRAAQQRFWNGPQRPPVGEFSFDTRKLSKDAFGPYNVYVDGGYYDTVETLTHAMDLVELLQGAATSDVEVRDREAWTVGFAAADNQA